MTLNTPAPTSECTFLETYSSSDTSSGVSRLLRDGDLVLAGADRQLATSSSQAHADPAPLTLCSRRQIVSAGNHIIATTLSRTADADENRAFNKPRSQPQRSIESGSYERYVHRGSCSCWWEGGKARATYILVYISKRVG